MKKFPNKQSAKQRWSDRIRKSTVKRRIARDRHLGASPSLEARRVLPSDKSSVPFNLANYYYQLAGLLMEFEEIKVLLDNSGDYEEEIVNQLLKSRGHDSMEEMVDDMNSDLDQLTSPQQSLLYSFMLRAIDIVSHADLEGN